MRRYAAVMHAARFVAALRPRSCTIEVHSLGARAGSCRSARLSAASVALFDEEQADPIGGFAVGVLGDEDRRGAGALLNRADQGRSESCSAIDAGEELVGDRGEPWDLEREEGPRSGQRMALRVGDQDGQLE